MESPIALESPVALENSSCRNLNCTMDPEETGEFIVVAAVRLVMAILSLFGAVSIVGSAIYRKTVCNSKVHPIFALSIVDILLSLLWISGSILWLEGGAKEENHSQVGCFAINLMTVILQCVAMNVVLIYALLAYASIKQKATDGVYAVQQRPLSIHIWPPLISFFAYLVAWTLPVVLIMTPFGVLANKYKLVQDANKLSCWCLPFYGNVLPRAQLGYHNGKESNTYLHNLHHFITSYAVVLIANFSIVFCCMVVIYYKVFRQIRRMILMQGITEDTPLFGATRAMIIDGQKKASRRVFLFFCIYFITGIMTVGFGIDNIVFAVEDTHHHHQKDEYSLTARQRRVYTFLLLEAIFVPVQGFLNALAYGWTREDFLSAMSSRRSMTLTNTGWQVTSEEEEEDDTVGKEECLHSQYSDLSLSNDEGELEEEKFAKIRGGCLRTPSPLQQPEVI